MNYDLHTTAGVAALVIAVAQFVGKSIPDSATGVLGLIRKAAKLIGLYAPNNTN